MEFPTLAVPVISGRSINPLKSQTKAKLKSAIYEAVLQLLNLNERMDRVEYSI